MIEKFSVQPASASATAGSGRLRQAFGKRDVWESRGSLILRQEIAGMLEANLANLEALAHGFVPKHLQRRTGF
jgi:hypothetical protein